MTACPVCHDENSRTELVNKVFDFDDRYVLVEGIPATVCQRCGERTFSSETVERTRHLIENSATPAKTVGLQVYDYA
ncbi:MAG: YgiT-type zinc finger protein [Chloroflexi bacterium]|nr:YgiT-type zinc finger protein [Chloroflexota bacterium]